MHWPQDKRFCFTVVDDPDFATVGTIRPVYDFLADLGMRTTRMVWVHAANEPGHPWGETCDDPEHLTMMLRLQKKGFELGFHGASPTSSSRRQVDDALEKFRSIFGSYPRCHCNHTGCVENLYWGQYRVSGWRRALYIASARGKPLPPSKGHVPESEYFWGDLCRDKIDYVRNFACDRVNTAAFDPWMP